MSKKSKKSSEVVVSEQVEAVESGSEWSLEERVCVLEMLVDRILASKYVVGRVDLNVDLTGEDETQQEMEEE